MKEGREADRRADSKFHFQDLQQQSSNHAGEGKIEVMPLDGWSAIVI
jgi:hypothetical protein